MATSEKGMTKHNSLPSPPRRKHTSSKGKSRSCFSVSDDTMLVFFTYLWRRHYVERGETLQVQASPRFGHCPLET